MIVMFLSTKKGTGHTSMMCIRPDNPLEGAIVCTDCTAFSRGNLRYKDKVLN